jgi:pimeloyl-ACP methyl ester carboxylesterase
VHSCPQAIHGFVNDSKVEKVLSEDRTPIAVWRTGEGPPLLLVHGGSADHIRWQPVLPALAEHFTVYVMDRRGRGQSGDAANYALEREFEDVAAVVDWVDGQVNLLGHSSGGLCSLEAALLTRNVRSLILYEPSMGIVVPGPDVVDQLEALLEQGNRDELLVFFFSAVAGASPEQIDHMRSLPAWEGRRAAAHTIPRELRADLDYAFEPERFREVRIPTLILEGGDSSAPFKKANEAVRAALPESRVAVMPGQRHTAMDTGPDIFTAEVLGFLRAS